METKELLQELTLEEKIRLLNGLDIQTTFPVERLGITSKKFIDGPHGLRDYFDFSVNPTHFPNMCSVGATWDIDLIYKMGEAIAKEALCHGVGVLLAPGINIKRYILNGRNSEYFSEDPVVTGEMAAGYVNGLQDTGIGACIKHLAANNQECNRLFLNAEVDERTLREIYLKAFQIAIKKSNPECVMSAYNKLNAVFCSENKFLLTDILRDEWNYDGFTIGDWGGIHDHCKSLMAGTDMLMPPDVDIIEKIKSGLADGRVTKARLDEAVERVLKSLTKVRPVKDASFDRNEHHALARKIAADGTVLLKNEGNLLPLTPEKYKKILIVGGFAEDPARTALGSPEVFPFPEYIESPLAEIRKLLPDVEIDYQPIYDRTTLNEKAVWSGVPIDQYFANTDLVIFFVGTRQSEESENYDRATATLNPIYDYLLTRAQIHKTKTAVVVQAGGAVIFDESYMKADALVHMWFAGEAAGGGIADVLTGAVNPSGKLTETFPKLMRRDMKPLQNLILDYSEKLDVGYRYYDKHPEEIEFPFGHGLSYTSFEYSELETKIEGDKIKASFSVKNIGGADGAEVAQVYVSYPDATVTRPVKELKAFSKVFLEKGEEKKVNVSFPLSELAYYNISLREWVIENGRYDIIVGASSRDIRLKGQIEYTEKTPYTTEATFFLSLGGEHDIVV